MVYVEMRRDMYFESLKKPNCKGLYRTAWSYVLGLDEVPTMKPQGEKKAEEDTEAGNA